MFSSLCHKSRSLTRLHLRNAPATPPPPPPEGTALVLNVFIQDSADCFARVETLFVDSPLAAAKTRLLLPEAPFVYNTPVEGSTLRRFRRKKLADPQAFGLVFKQIFFNGNRLSVRTLTADEWASSCELEHLADPRSFLDLVNFDDKSCLYPEWNHLYALMVDDHWILPGQAQELHFRLISATLYYTRSRPPGSRRRCGRSMRHPHTTRTRRLVQALDADERRYPVRGSQRKLPSAWDDQFIAALKDRSWKRHRKHQYKRIVDV